MIIFDNFYVWEFINIVINGKNERDWDYYWLNLISGKNFEVYISTVIYSFFVFWCYILVEWYKYLNIYYLSKF